jgi:hypothetical protein
MAMPYFGAAKDSTVLLQTKPIAPDIKPRFPQERKQVTSVPRGTLQIPGHEAACPAMSRKELMFRMEQCGPAVGRSTWNITSPETGFRFRIRSSVPRGTLLALRPLGKAEAVRIFMLPVDQQRKSSALGSRALTSWCQPPANRPSGLRMSSLGISVPRGTLGQRRAIRNPTFYECVRLRVVFHVEHCESCGIHCGLPKGPPGRISHLQPPMWALLGPRRPTFLPRLGIADHFLFFWFTAVYYSDCYLGRFMRARVGEVSHFALVLMAYALSMSAI